MPTSYCGLRLFIVAGYAHFIVSTTATLQKLIDAARGGKHQAFHLERIKSAKQEAQCSCSL